MKIKRLLKNGIRLMIEADGSITTVIIRVSRKQLLAILDMILPDDEPEKT